MGPRDAPLTLVVPVYNEGENFAALLEQIEHSIDPPFTMKVVYDFDEDTTLPVVRAAQGARPWLHLLKNDLGRGVLNALKVGLTSVESGPLLIVMGDLSDDLSIVREMLERYRNGADVVVASRYCTGGRHIGGPLLKRILSEAAGRSLHVVGALPVSDATNNFRLYDAALVRELGIESKAGFELALELTAKAFRAGRRIEEVPCTWRDRTAGTSRFSLRAWLPHYLRWYGYALTGVKL